MIMTVEELFDYMNCPLHHNFKYIKCIPDNDISDKQKFNDSIDLVVRNFYYMLMDDKFLNPNELKMKWQTACQSTGHIIEANDSIKALKILTSFHDWAKDNCGVAFDIDRECLIPIGDDKICYKLPIIRQKFDKTVDILHLKHWKASIDTFKIETDIEFALSVLAFHIVYDSVPDTVTVFNCITGKELILRIGNNELTRIQSTIDNIMKAVASNIKYPRWNIYCNTCAYKPQCKSWRG